MPITFSKDLFLAAKPKTLREFYAQVLDQPLPPMAEVGELYESYGFGPRAWYIGSAEQNMRLMQKLRASAESPESLPPPVSKELPARR